MARRPTAKRQITKKRVLLVIDYHIDVLKNFADVAKSEGYASSYASNGISVLKALRHDLERRCDYGTFPSDD